MTEQPAACISACAVFDCETCNHRLRSRCYGCAQGNALLAGNGKEQCALFACTRSHNVATCGDCTEPTCPFTRSLEMVCPLRGSFESRRCYARKMSDYFSGRRPTRQEVTLVARKLDKVITRLPWYLFAVEDFLSHGVETVSSADIALKVGVKSWVVRRDLSQFGGFGHPSLGYETALLHDSLSEILQLNTENKIVWVGAARIDADKGLIQRFREHKYRIVAIFAVDTSTAPEMVGGIRVSPVANVPRMVKELGAEGAVIATSAEAAQPAADALIAAGIKGILNLTSTPIAAPSDVCVRNIDLVAELFTLSYYCRQIHEGEDTEGAPDATD